jgi:hypothetical protein
MEEFRTRAADGDKMAKERLQHPAICHRLGRKDGFSAPSGVLKLNNP